MAEPGTYMHLRLCMGTCLLRQQPGLGPHTVSSVQTPESVLQARGAAPLTPGETAAAPRAGEAQEVRRGHPGWLLWAPAWTPGLL